MGIVLKRWAATGRGGSNGGPTVIRTCDDLKNYYFQITSPAEIEFR